MAHPKMKAITMPFKEVKVDEEGNPVFDKKIGELSYRTVYRRVRHNALYLPNYKAEKPTC
jgi:hypothetical protein